MQFGDVYIISDSSAPLVMAVGDSQFPVVGCVKGLNKGMLGTLEKRVVYASLIRVSTLSMRGLTASA